MKKNNLSSLLLIGVLALAGTSCSNDDGSMPDPEPLANIVATAQATPDLSNLVAALTTADQSAGTDLVGTLSGNGPFTVFAPTNAAFDALLAQLDGFDTLDDFDTDEERALLTSILTYHVVAGAAVFSSDLSEGQEVITFQGESLSVSLQGGVSITDATGTPATVGPADIEASNGVVHVINKVLVPQSVLDALAGEAPQTIADLAVATEDLSNLVAALTEAGLVSALEQTGAFTVFAPTNAAVETFLADNGFANVSEVPVNLLTQILLNHVVPGKFLSTELSTDYVSSLSTAGPDGAKLSLFIDTASGVTINGISDVVTPDIEASNGVVHIVDAVIGLPTLVDHALANPGFTSLVDALTSGGNSTFTDLLSGDGPFTVFAPVNDAFTAFANPDGNELNNILANHVISGAAAFSAGLTNSYANTLGENADSDALSLYINTDLGIVTLNGTSDVIQPDVVAVNGVIHGVDAVIDIPTVVTFATADPNFSTLVSALTELTPGTDFAGILSRTEGGNGDGLDPAFTVFAPTNAAFDALASVPEESVLTQVLLHHVVSGNVRSEDLTDGIMPATLEGDMITINLPGSGENIADVTDGAGNTGIGIIGVDVQAGNGVIHVVNQVLIPDTNN